VRTLAREAGFRSHTYLQRLLNGEKTTCRAERAVAICALLKIPLDTLFVTNVTTHSGRIVQGQSSRRPAKPTAVVRRKAS